ncbi:MAG: hypothetical protein AB1Z66_03365 [Candidatus Limnocylindrales bacterium]
MTLGTGSCRIAKKGAPMKHVHRFAISALAAILSLALASGVVLADDWLDRRAAGIAEKNGWTLGLAKAYLRTPGLVDRPLAKLARTDPSYAGSYWTEKGALTVMFKDEAPRGVLREVRDAALVKVNAKIVEYSMKDVERMQREIEGVLDELGIVEWGTALPVWPQQVIVDVRTSDPQMQQAILDGIAAVVPEGVTAINFTDQPLFRPHVPSGLAPEPFPSTDPSIVGQSSDAPVEPDASERSEEADAG